MDRDKTNEEKVGTPVLRRPRKAQEIERSLGLNAVSLRNLNRCLFPIVILNIHRDLVIYWRTKQW